MNEVRWERDLKAIEDVPISIPLEIKKAISKLIKKGGND